MTKLHKGIVSGLIITLGVIVILLMLFGCSTHRPRYDKYDKDGLLKSSTPLYLDKNKGKRPKPVKR
jgi:hypothetical protein